MMVKACCAFCGAVCMNTGEERELDADALLDSLIAAGHVKPVQTQADMSKPKKERKTTKK